MSNIPLVFSFSKDYNIAEMTLFYLVIFRQIYFWNDMQTAQGVFSWFYFFVRIIQTQERGSSPWMN